jgi:dienelactone hydrolase
MLILSNLAKEASMIRILQTIGIFLFCGGTALAAVQGQEVTYQAGATQLHGYLASDPASTAKRPGILVVHEWWGHDEYARDRARMLAERGYTALALDMYGEGRQADHPQDAGKFAGEVRRNLPLAKERFTAAMEALRQHPTVDGERIAAIGYCFGGSVVLEMARAGLDLDAVASFHGSLETSNPAQSGMVKARVLVANGADDPMIPAEQVAAFRQEMEAAGVDYRLLNYPGAKHSFTNPRADLYGEKFNLPLAYDAEADRQSWQALLEFLAETFR